MATLAEIRNSIAVKLQDETNQGVSAASITAAVNDAIDYYKNERFWFNEAVSTITLTQGNPVVPNIPADFLVELEDGGLSILYNQITYPIYKRPSALFDAENIQGNGIPYIYTYRNKAFELYYYPQTNYALTLRYLRDYADLSDTSPTNAFTENAATMIVYDALSRIYAELKQDEKMESYYSARAANEKSNLMKRSSALTGTGRLTLYSNFL